MTRRDRKSGSRIDYENAVTLLEKGSSEEKQSLGANPEAPGEMLYFLASDEEQVVRKAVAANSSTPAKASDILVEDEDEEVRAELARRIGRLLPNHTPKERDKALEHAIATIEKLAQDQADHVRAIVAEEICQSDGISHETAMRLAQDPVADVACPILEYSVLLSDADLLEIIAAGAAEEALDAIARRSHVTEQVSDALINEVDTPPIVSLLTNPNAEVREKTLAKIAKQAEYMAELHKPLALRAGLSNRVIKRMSGYLASELLDYMIQESDLEPSMVKRLKKQVSKNLKNKPFKREGPDPRDLVLQAQAGGYFNSKFIQDAASVGNKELVCVSMATLLQRHPFHIERIIDSGSGYGITAICWKAMLPMRVAWDIQTNCAKVKTRHLVYARNGVDYALTPQELRWHLEYWGFTYDEHDQNTGSKGKKDDWQEALDETPVGLLEHKGGQMDTAVGENPLGEEVDKLLDRKV